MDKIIKWIDDNELDSIYTSDYWNDIEKEKEKIWWLNDVKDIHFLYKHLIDSGLDKEIKSVKEHIKPRKNIKVADLASGTGWFSSILSNIDNIEEVSSVEISKHRIGDLFEKTVHFMQGDPQKIKRYLGSFYDLKFKNPLDIIFLCQGFHHAQKPFHLLVECEKNLNKGGEIILLGEHYISIWMLVKKFFKYTITKGKLTLNFFDLFPPDEKLGDHYYRSSDYFLMASSIGLELTIKKTSLRNIIYIFKKV